MGLKILRVFSFWEAKRDCSMQAHPLSESNLVVPTRKFLGSFGTIRTLKVAGEEFCLGGSYLGLSAEALSQFTGVRCVGLVGADVLGRFDHVFNSSDGNLTVSIVDWGGCGNGWL